MTITVRQEHIDAARHPRELHCWKCPVWQAAEEAGVKGIYNVTASLIHCDDGKYEFHRRNSIVMPLAATVWIFRFDTGKLVEPFSFEVDYE